MMDLYFQLLQLWPVYFFVISMMIWAGIVTPDIIKKRREFKLDLARENRKAQEAIAKAAEARRQEEEMRLERIRLEQKDSS